MPNSISGKSGESPYLSRLFNLGSENIDRIPWLFKPIEPIINKMSYVIEYIHLANGNHWILTICATSLIIRVFLLPIFYFHSKRISKVANKSGMMKLFQHIYNTSELTKKDKIKKLFKIIFRSSRILKLKPFNIILYYMFLFPFITSTIFGLRKVMG
jgi:membrane protein insertase Oxa1/YidC/SpoIIIJ